MSGRTPIGTPGSWDADRILDAIDEAVVAIDFNYQIHRWNRAAERLFGWRSDEINPPFVSYQISLNIGYETRFEIIKKIRTGEVWSGPLQLCDKSSQSLNLETTISGLRDEQNRLCGFISVHRRVPGVKASLQSLGGGSKLFNHSNDVIVVTDPDARVVSWNPAAERVLKWRASEVLDRDLRDFIPTDHQFALIGSALAAGSTWRAEVSVKDRDGEEVRLDADVTMVPGEQGQPLGYLSIGRDVTARRRTEEALRQSEARVRALLSAIPDTFILVNSEGVLLDYVSNGTPGFQAQQELRLGTRLSDVFPALAQQAITSVRRVLTGQPMQCFELQQELDGELRDYEARVVSSSVTEALIIVSDVTSHKNIERQLRESEERFRHLVEQRQIGVYMIQGDRFQYINPRFCAICGYEPDEILRQPSSLWMVLPEDRELVADRQTQRLRGEDVGPYSFHMRRKDGEIITVEVFGARTTYRGQHALIGTLVDITERKRAEEALRESEERYRTVVSSLSEGVLVHTVEGRILTANESACRILGARPDQLQERSLFDGSWTMLSSDGKLLAPGEQPSSITVRTGASYTGVLIGISRLITPRCELLTWLELNSRPLVRRGESSPYAAVVSFVDVTERKRTADELHRQAFYDPLTGLPNRALFLDRVERALSHARRHDQQVALCFIDLDQFKGLNDSLGHAVGDQFLEQVAHRLSRCVREGDTVARLGGDEFTLLLPAISAADDAERVAERVLDSLRQPFRLGEHELRTTASIGISVFPHDGSEVSQLLRAADAAMYRVKAAGKNNFKCFSLG